MIDKAQYDQLIEAMRGGGFESVTKLLNGCVVITDLGATDLVEVLDELPIGIRPDEILTQNPPQKTREWSQFILIFWKDPGAVAETRRARGKPPGGKGDGEIGE